MPGVFSLRDGELIRLQEAPYEAESVLQELVERFPDLLSSGDHEPWILVKREAGVRLGDQDATTGSLDHLYLDASAVPTLVEVKRSSDTRLRREVVAQLLDYAANARHEWGQGRLRSWFEERLHDAGRDPEEALLDAFASVEDIEEYWAQVETNLNADRLRLVFVADEIPPSLRRIVEYLNRRMTATEVIAIEVRQFLDESGEHQMIVPTVLGDTEAANATKGKRDTRVWDEATLLSALAESSGPQAVEVARRLLTWGKAQGLRLTYGRGANLGSCSFGAPVDSGVFWALAIWSNGGIELGFQHMRTQPPFDSAERREELRVQLTQIPGIEIPAGRLSGRPSIQILALAEPDAFDAFKEAFQGAFKLVRASAP